MIFYKVPLARHDVSTGAITSFAIERVPLGAGWVVALYGRKTAGYLATARKDEPRIFKVLDSAVSALEEIGFSVLKLS